MNPKRFFICFLVFFLYAGLLRGFAAELPDLNPDRLGLTPEETRWLKTALPVRVAGPRAFPPFHYYDDQGILKGMSADYLFMVMGALGLDVTIERSIPWPQVLEKAKTGQIDLIPCVARTLDRESFISFSTPYLSFPLVILSRKDAPFIGSIQDLYGKKIAVIRGNAVPDWLKADRIPFEPFYVGSPTEQLEALSLGQVDAGIENLAAASYLIEKFGLMNVKVAAPTPYGSYDLHMGVRKGLPELLGIINKALGQITAEQQMQIRGKWLSVRYEHGLRPMDILGWVLGVIVVAALLLMGFWVWNRKLKEEADRRGALITRLEAAMAEIRTLQGIVPICANCKKIRDDQGYWNLLESYIEKHSNASFSHSMCPECSEHLYGKAAWYKKKKNQQP